MTIVGKLKAHKSSSKWMVADQKFTVDALRNPWIVRNLKKFRAERRTVSIFLNEKHQLLSVRMLK